MVSAAPRRDLMTSEYWRLALSSSRSTLLDSVKLVSYARIVANNRTGTMAHTAAIHAKRLPMRLVTGAQSIPEASCKGGFLEEVALYRGSPTHCCALRPIQCGILRARPEKGMLTGSRYCRARTDCLSGRSA